MAARRKRQAKRRTAKKAADQGDLLRGRFAGGIHPALDRINLTDFKVRVLDTGKGTGAITRVLLDSTDGEREWTTIGVSENIIEASWQALVDSLVYGLLHADG